MMDLETLIRILRNNWHSECDVIKKLPLSHKPKIANLNPIRNQQYQYLETVAGLELLLSDDQDKEMVGYNIIDSAKFTWFVLRWA
jgi:hypothetical protein